MIFLPFLLIFSSFSVETLSPFLTLFMCLLLLFMVYIVKRNRKQISLGRKITVRWTIFLLLFLYFQYFFVRLLCFSKFFVENIVGIMFLFMFLTYFVYGQLFFFEGHEIWSFKAYFPLLLFFMLSFVLKGHLYELSTFTKYIKCLYIMLWDIEKSH